MNHLNKKKTKYYTKSNIVNQCIELIKIYIDISNDNLIIEPNARNRLFIMNILLQIIYILYFYY